MMMFRLIVYSLSLISIYTVTLITLRSYCNAFWYTTFMVCPPGARTAQVHGVGSACAVCIICWITLVYRYYFKEM
jgi:hypothetical protein